MIRTIRLAAIPGDGIGPEVLGEAQRVLEVVVASTGTSIDTTTYDLGARRWLATGELLPESVLAEIRGHDAILLGAAGPRLAGRRSARPARRRTRC